MTVFNLGHICYNARLQRQEEEAEMKKILVEKKLKRTDRGFLE